MALKGNPIMYQTTNVVAVIVALVMNSLVNILPLNGVTTGRVSDFYPNLFTPPGYVFSIWSVIYILAFAFMIYQVRPSQRSVSYLAQIGYFYLISAVANTSWLFIFHYSYGVPNLLVVSLIPMIVLILCLLTIYLRLGVGRQEVSTNQKLIVHLHFSVYLGWISLAIIANIASVLNVLIPGIPESTQALGTAAVIFVALLIAANMVVVRRDFAFCLVVIWASIGIALNRIAVPIIFSASVATIVILFALILLVPFLKKRNIVDFYMVRGKG